MGLRALPPAFCSDLSSLVWPMPAEDFVSGAMHADVFYLRGTARRLALLEEPLGSFDLRYLFAHGDEATIWTQGGRQTTRGTDDERDVDALVPGATVQTHLATKLAFGRKFISELARQMNLESGFFSIFASRDTHTATHYDRNYNFTIQLSGEKTWTVHREGPAIVAPSDNMAFDADRLASMLPHMHGATSREPGHRASIYQLAPGDILYVPPGYWHATECAGLSVSLNLSLEPRAWFQVLGGALMRHLESQPEWRAPFGIATQELAAGYLTRLKQIVDSLTAEDVVAIARERSTVHMDEPLRRTLGSLLMWERNGAGLHFGVDELRFLARGAHGRWIEIVKSDWEPALVALAKLDEPKTARELSAETRLDCERMVDFVQRLVRLGYLTGT